jgi:hypothetical protein
MKCRNRKERKKEKPNMSRTPQKKKEKKKVTCAYVV